jgi:hypothetical protein
MASAWGRVRSVAAADFADARQASEAVEACMAGFRAAVAARTPGDIASISMNDVLARAGREGLIGASLQGSLAALFASAERVRFGGVAADGELARSLVERCLEALDEMQRPRPARIETAQEAHAV